jgi:hypothetical protein
MFSPKSKKAWREAVGAGAKILSPVPTATRLRVLRFRLGFASARQVGAASPHYLFPHFKLARTRLRIAIV